jgi:hypothetical protein
MPRFFRQNLHAICLNPAYYPELQGMKELHLQDRETNYYTLYHSGYRRFKDYLHQMNLDPGNLRTNEILELMNRFNQAQPSENTRLKLILLMNARNRENFLISQQKTSFLSDAEPVTVGGLKLQKGGVRNCIVMHQDGSIYIRPKIIGDLASNRIGVSHSSLAPLNGEPVAFAGCFVHTREKGWMLENVSGHYGTRATQMRYFVQQLSESGIDIQPLTLIFHIRNHRSAAQKFTIIEENAQLFLARYAKSQAAIAEQLSNSPGLRS